MALQSGVSAAGEFVESSDHRKLFLRSWRPKAIRAVVAIIHEQGADGSQYLHFAEALATCGVATYAIDLRGCGRSPGSCFQLLPINGYLRDTHATVSRISEGEAAQPLFLLGHGTGALVACLYALRHEDQLDGIICEGIALDPPWNAATLHVPSRLAVPFSWLSRATLRVNHHRGEALRKLSLPLLLLHGSEDVVAPPSGSEYLHGRVGSRDKTLQVFEGYRHDLVNDYGHAIAREKTREWIEAQLNSSACRRRIGIEYINE